MTLPNFLVIGAAKAGTSSLAQYLGQHPEVFVNREWKELRVFAYDDHPPAGNGPGDVESNRHTTTTLAAYAAYFADANGEKAIGEVSPVYLYSERAPASIQQYVPNAKLIAILRDPAERAYSHYLHLLRDQRESLWDFGAALAAEDCRVRDNWEWSWHYRRVGLYHDQLKRYFERFNRAQIRVYLYEDFLADPVGLLQDIFRFLAVDERFVPDTSVRHNTSSVPRRRAAAQAMLAAHTSIKRILKPVQRLIPRSVWRGGTAAFWQMYDANLVKPALSPDHRRQLVTGYHDDIVRLEALIDRDLSRWREYR